MHFKCILRPSANISIAESEAVGRKVVYSSDRYEPVTDSWALVHRFVYILKLILFKHTK